MLLRTSTKLGKISAPHKGACMKQEIKYFEKGVCKIHINDPQLKDKLANWQDMRRLNIYFDKKGVCGWDYLFPAKLYNRVAQLAGLPLKKKNENRILAGQQSKVGTGENRYDFTKVNSHQTPQDASKIEGPSKDTAKE